MIDFPFSGIHSLHALVQIGLNHQHDPRDKSEHDQQN
jgi:hypothetical protein